MKLAVIPGKRPRRRKRSLKRLKWLAQTVRRLVFSRFDKIEEEKKHLPQAGPNVFVSRNVDLPEGASISDLDRYCPVLEYDLGCWYSQERF